MAVSVDRQSLPYVEFLGILSGVNLVQDPRAKEAFQATMSKGLAIPRKSKRGFIGAHGSKKELVVALTVWIPGFMVNPRRD